MSTVIKTHRGNSTYMTEGAGASIVLNEGELFVEYPDTGLATVGSKMKIGDGVSRYDELPYIVGGGSEEVQIRNFSYTGAIQTFIAPETTEYTLEVWGGQGGSNSTTRGGYGGYSVGKIELEENDVLYICVGGAGTGGETTTPGFNGGGAANHAGSWERGSGGGATHIAKVNGLLNTLSSNLSDILIVAGGGGGAGCFTYTECGDGGDAGGYIAADGKQVESSLIADVGHGGTQLAGGLGGSNNGDDGTFGQGANRTSDDNYGGSGGGGGLYGGGASCNTSGAGGGSSYISPDLTQACMYGYNVQESTDLETRTVSVLVYSALPTSEYAKAENGYARISWGGKTPIEYDDIKNKPQINGVTLSGDKSGADLGLVSTSETEGLLKNDGTVDTSKHVHLQPTGTSAGSNISTKTWTGLSSFYGDYIWTDGDNIYYSLNGNNYVLDKTTGTWNTKTWNGSIGNIDGSQVWTDGDNIYYSYNSTQYVLDKSTSTWISKTWTGLTKFNGSYIWTDGTNIYYSYINMTGSTSNQYVLDKTTSTWNTKTWNGYSSINGSQVWTDGTNIYYDQNNNIISHYVLDKSTNTWSAKTWNGYSSIIGSQVWTDGTNIYYSYQDNQYVLDKSTSTWNTKTWTGLTSFNGSILWTDGDNIYYSNGNNQYVFDKIPVYGDGFVKTDGTIDTNTYALASAIPGVATASAVGTVKPDGTTITVDANGTISANADTSNYIQKSATEGLVKNDGTIDESAFVRLKLGLTGNISAKTWNVNIQWSSKIWTDGDNIYYSYNNEQYVLDKSTGTWSTKTWNGNTGIYAGNAIWTDGDNIYYSNYNDQYVLDKSTSTWSTKTWNNQPNNFYGECIWTDGTNIYYSDYNYNHYVLDKSTSTWNAKTWNGYTSFDADSIWTDGENIYSSRSGNNYVLDKSTSTWSTKSWTGLTSISGTSIWTDGDNIYYSGGSSSNQYVLDKSTSTWSAKTWTGLTSFYGSNLWTDGENIYYSNTSGNYVFDSVNKNTDGFVKTDGTIVSSPIAKLRYTITATNWSNSVDANGYYTYTVTLSPTLALSYPPNIYIAGAGDSTFPTDTEKEQYALLEQCNHTATNSLTLYAKTKPDTTFYVYIEGQVG